MASIAWAPRARQDLRDIVEHISDDSPVTARRFAEKLVSRVGSLSRQPLSGGLVPEDDSETYRQILQGSYRVIYRIDRATVLIVAVHHASRLLHSTDLESDE